MMRRRSALEPTSIAAKRGMSHAQTSDEIAPTLASRLRMRARHAVVTCFFLASALASGACASDPPRAPHPLHPIPEDRARDLIARTFTAAGVTPEANRLVLVKERRVQLEVAAAGHKYGVAYLTAQDWAQAGD